MEDQTIEQRLDEILSWGSRATEKWNIHKAGKNDPAQYADEIFGGERAQAKQNLYQLISREVIGEDEFWTRKRRMQFSTNDLDSFSHLFAVNNTKKEQRQTLAKLFGITEGEK